MKKLFATAISCALVTLANTGAVQAQATSTGAGQGYPAKTVRVICPWPAGGLIDVVGRIVFQKMSENTGLLYASSGAGTFSHLAMALLDNMAGTQMVNVNKTPRKRRAAIQLHYSHGNAIIKV